MTATDVSQYNNLGIQELTVDEVDSIGGGSITGAAALGAVGAIGAATFGSAWGAVAVSAAFAAAPIAVIAMGGLSLYGAYKVMAH